MFAASHMPGRTALATALCAAENDVERAALCFALGEPDGDDAGTTADAPQWRKLIPAPDADGVVRGVDGRWWRMPDAQAVVQAFTRPIQVDINHSSELAAPKGDESPAQGWVEQIEVRDGAIWGRIEWNTRGRQALADKDYRYLSPVFKYTRDTREIARLTSVALTNDPNFDLALNHRAATEETPTVEKAILLALGLAATASADEALTAINQMKSDLDTARNRTESPSLEKFVPRADYDTALNRAQTAEGKLQEHEQTAHKEKVETAINAALKAGKITPATREYHTAQCMAEGGLERFQQFVEAAPVIADASDLDGKKPGQGTDTALNAAEKKVAALFGNSAEDIAKYGKQENA